MAKIAVEYKSDVCPPPSQVVAKGDQWTVSEVVCTLGPRDRPFEEFHSCASVAIVIAGTFQYHSHTGREMMTPGSLLLGSTGQSFECGHEHGTGDRCLVFSYAPELFEHIAVETGGSGRKPAFKASRVPPLRELSPLITAASTALSRSAQAPWDELSLQLAARTLELDKGASPSGSRTETGATARVTRVVRMMEHDPAAPHDIATLAREARLSPYHFLRTFQSLTGITPHQYLRRLRLRWAATRLSTESAKVLDIALDCGFGDISNFNRNFRAEFGISPRTHRNQTNYT